MGQRIVQVDAFTDRPFAGNPVAYQASARGGVLEVGLRGDRVRLGGKAVTVMVGELLV